MASDNEVIAKLIVEGVTEFKAQLESTTTDTDKVKANVKAIGVEGSKAFDTMSQEVSDADSSIKQISQSTASYKTQLKQMRAEIVTLTIELTKMKEAGQQGTQQFNNLDAKIKGLTNDAGRLDDVIRDVSGTVKNAGSDTRGLDMTIRKVQTVAAGFQLAQGAAALFGGENKELSNALIKLNGIMVVTSALQQIQNEYLKEDSVLTGVATVAKRAYAGAVAFATGAMSAFRIVLISLGLVGLIALLSIVVLNWEKLKAAITGASEAQQKINKDTDEALKNSAKERFELESLIRIQGDERISREQKLRLFHEQQKLYPQTLKDVTDEAFLQGKANDKLKELLPLLKDKALLQVYNNRLIEAQSKLEEKRKDDGGLFSKILVNIGLGIVAYNTQTKAIKEAQGEVDEYAKKYDALLATINKGGNLDKETAIDSVNKKIQVTKEKIKELKNELPIKFTVEAQLDKFDEIFGGLISKTEAELKSLFTAELFLGTNPKDNPQIQFLISQLENYKQKLEEAKIKYDALVNPDIVGGGIIQTPNLRATSNVKPLTFWEKLFGTKEENTEQERMQQERIKKATFIINQINEIGSQISDVASKAISIKANNELSVLEEKKKKGLITEKEYEKQSAKIKNEAAEKQRAIDIAMALAKVPLIVLNALVSAPFPANIVLAALGGALGLAQVAILASTPLPKFKQGGSVAKRFGLINGKPHSAGGERIEVEGNEYVMKGDAVKKYGVKFFDEVNSLKFNPILAMPKQAVKFHKRDTKMYEHMAIISSYLKQNTKADMKGNSILKEISSKLNHTREYV